MKGALGGVHRSIVTNGSRWHLISNAAAVGRKDSAREGKSWGRRWEQKNAVILSSPAGENGAGRVRSSATSFRPIDVTERTNTTSAAPLRTVGEGRGFSPCDPQNVH